MTRAILLLLSFFSVNICVAQFRHSNDTPRLRSSSVPAQQSFFTPNHLVVEGNLIHSEFSPTDFVRSEILKLEGQEGDALKKRDTIALRKLWSRDFSLDTPTDRVVADKNGLPYYVIFYRTIEDVRIMDDFAYTNGHELVQTLNIYKKLEEPVRRNFRHIWARRHGSWILISKTN